MSATEEQVVTLLRDVVAHGPDGSGLSVEDAARSGRGRARRRAVLQVAGVMAAVVVLAAATTVLPRVVGGGPAGPSVGVTAEPTQNPVRRLYAAYDAATVRVGLPVLDTVWAVQPYVRMGAPGEFRDFPGSRSLQTFGTPGSALDFQTVELDPAQVLSTEEDLCGAYLANGFGCTTSTPDEGLTLVRLLHRPEGPLVGVELWHPDGVVVVSRNGDAGGAPVTDEQLLALAQDPALRW